MPRLAGESMSELFFHTEDAGQAGESVGEASLHLEEPGWASETPSDTVGPQLGCSLWTGRCDRLEKSEATEPI